LSAGCVVYAPGDEGWRVLMIRDRFGRWTLPKGVVEEGETSEQAALREVEEETGVAARLEGPVGETAYTYRDGSGSAVRKRVLFFLARAAAAGGLRPRRGELDTAAWVAPAEVLELSGYDNLEHVLRAGLDRLPEFGPRGRSRT